MITHDNVDDVSRDTINIRVEKEDDPVNEFLSTSLFNITHLPLLSCKSILYIREIIVCR